MFKQPLVQFIDVEKSFLGNHPIFSNVNFKINQGEFLFLTGISGAGKSTIFRLILGLETPNKGRVIFNNYNVHQLPKKVSPKHLRSVGMVFQDYKLLAHQSPKKNITIPLQIAGLIGSKAEKKINNIVDAIGIRPLLKRPTKSLSGGEQQLIAIARAAVHSPQLILADEPTANLDPQMGAKIIDILKQLNGMGITVVIATHDIHLIKSHEKRTILIKNSDLIEVQ